MAIHGDVDAHLAKLREFLNAWDPYCLIESGAPEDEFDPERGPIYGALTSGEIDSKEALAHRIAAIFRHWFDDSFTPENCSGIANTIWNWWQEP